MLEFSRRTQHLWGNDVVQRAASGEFEVVHKGNGKMDLRQSAPSSSRSSIEFPGMTDVATMPAESVSLRPTVYVDTSVPSYLTSKRTRAMPIARFQLVTCLWWNGHSRVPLPANPHAGSHHSAGGYRESVADS